jgi:hypothetical protein
VKAQIVKPEAVRARRREAKRKAYTRKDKAQVIERLTREQHGCCAICGQDDRRLVLDHCHTSGNPRAMLCTQCNAGLVLFHEDPDRLRKAAAYARKWAQA